MVKVDKIVDVTWFKCIIELYFHVKSASQFSSRCLQEEKYLLSSIKCNVIHFILLFVCAVIINLSVLWSFYEQTLGANLG